MTANPTNLASAVGLRPGDKIDKYEVVQQIGAGGFSVVWKAYDRLLDKHVAVKQVTVDSSVDEESFRERFRAEAAIQKKAAEDHKHLVRVIDFIEDPRGLFIVMEFVDGPSLEHLLIQNPGPVDVKTSLGIAAAAAVGLGAIHDKGIIHRDLKPSNILLPNTGGLKICDFGLASLMVDQETPAVGTVRYMAPELLSAQKVDGRADVYSLGIILYEMLIGRANFEDAFKIVLRDQRNVALRWMKWHTNPKVKAPPIKQYVPTVPDPIAQLVERMMEKDPNQRIASASQLLDAMRRQLSAPAATAATPVTPGRPSAVATAGPVGDQTVKLKKKNKVVLIAAVTVIVWAVLGVGYLLYTQSQEKTAQEAAEKAVMTDYFAAGTLFKTAVAGKASFDDASLAFKQVLVDHEAHREMPVPVAGNERRPLEQSVQAHIHFCEARKEFDLRNYARTLELLDKAESLGSIKLDTIERLRDDALLLRSIDEMEKKVLAEVAKANFFGAKHQWQQFRTNFYKNLSKEQKDRWEELYQQIEAQRETKEAESVLAQAEEVAKTNREEAIGLIQDHFAKTGSTNRQLKAYLGALQGASTFENAIVRGKSAEQGSNWEGAIEAYESALKSNRKEAEALGLPTTIRKIKARVAVGKGLAALTSGDTDLATKFFSDALADDPENVEAKNQLAKLDNAGKLAAVKRQATLAFENKEYDKSINFWKQARDLGEDSSVVSAEITKAEIQIAVAAMEKAWAGDDDDAATLKCIEAVLVLDPGNTRAPTLKTLIETRKRIRALIASGEAARAKGQFGDSKRDLRRAQDIAKGIEDATIREQLLALATSHLNEVEYEDNLSKAKRDFELGKLDTARAWALNAVKGKATDEAKALLAKIEAALAAKPPTE